MNTYEIVTEKIISPLEQGMIPWRRPWTSTGLPRNLLTKRPYRGVNFFLLSATKYVSPYWVTMRQATELGGQVRKGERSQIVVFWKVDRIANRIESEPQEKELNTEDKGRQRSVLKFYRLFNVEQCELPQAVHEKLPKVETYQRDPIEAGERIVARMPNDPEIEYAGSKAFYSSLTDRITLPCLNCSLMPPNFTPPRFMRCRTRLVIPSGLTGRQLPTPLHLFRLCTVSRSSSSKCQQPTCAQKRASCRRSLGSRPRMFRAASRNYGTTDAWLLSLRRKLREQPISY
jgi:N-terminal domain of anti-restriction factor ArdC